MSYDAGNPAFMEEDRLRTRVRELEAVLKKLVCRNPTPYAAIFEEAERVLGAVLSGSPAAPKEPLPLGVHRYQPPVADRCRLCLYPESATWHPKGSGAPTPPSRPYCENLSHPSGVDRKACECATTEGSAATPECQHVPGGDGHCKRCDAPTDPALLACRWCAMGWALEYQIKPRNPRHHLYPADFKGQRAGIGPYCEHPVSEGREP